MRQNLKTKIRAIFLAILPGILIGLFVLSANIYYDIDLQKWITEGVQKILGQLQTTATTTLATLEGRVGIGTELPLYKLDVSGNVRLGNASSSEIVFEGFIQSGIIPYYDAFYNLGSQNFRWANLYTNELTVSSSSTLGTVVSGIWQASPIEISYGGTGLTFLGQANQILGVKADQSSLEYKNITSLLQAGQGISIEGTQIATISNTGVLSLNSLTGILNLQGTPNQIFISTSPNTISFSLPQDIATSSSPSFYTLNLTSPLLVSSGGTGLSSVASGALLYGSGSGVLNVLPIGQAGQILVSTGSQPNWQSLSSLSILTGQGAQNYLAKWTDNLSLATTTIYEANEKVGIGTTNPNYTLTVNGDLYVSATSTLGSATSTPVIFGGYIQSNVIPFSDATYTLGAPSFRWANLYAATTTIGGTIIIGSQTIEGTATTTLFTSGNPNQLVLGANGLVGIGTMAPSQKLTVAGNIGIQAGTNAFVGTLDNYALSLRTNNTDRIFITNDGNVGIGTTAPAYKLTVSGDVAVSQNIYLSTSSLIYIGTNSGSSGQFLRRTATGLDWSEPLAVIPWPLRAPAGQEGTASAPAYSFELYPATGMFLATSTGSLAFSASSTQVLTLTPSGNVGIGTTNPSYRLDVAGVIRGQDNLYITGNVGIGTTAPSFKLDVQGGDINVSANLRTGGTIRLDSSGNLSNIGTISSTYLTTGASYVNVAGASTVFQMQGTTIITSGRALQNLTGISSSGTITFTGLTANRLVATDASSNLVTTISSANLAASVTDETGTGLLVFNTSPTFSTQITTPLIYGSSAASGNLTLRSTSNATKGYIILADDGGNVGIGTTAPGAKLDVLGTSDQLRLTYSAGSIYGTFKIDSAGDLTIAPSGDEIIVPDDNLKICAGGGCPSALYSGTGNLQVEGKIQIDSSFGSVVIKKIRINFCKTGSYTGNLGGRDGANAKCRSGCGEGYSFARCGYLGVTNLINSGYRWAIINSNYNSNELMLSMVVAQNLYPVAWCDGGSNTCGNWTTESSGEYGSICNWNSVNYSGSRTCDIWSAVLCVNTVEE